MKKIFLILLYFISINVFSQDSRFIIFRKSLKENGKWVYKDEFCDIGINFNESSIKVDLDILDFWEILKVYPMKVEGKINSVEYDLKDLLGIYCKMFISFSDDTPKEATITITYPNKTIIWDFRER